MHSLSPAAVAVFMARRQPNCDGCLSWLQLWIWRSKHSFLAGSNIHYDAGISNGCPCRVVARIPTLKFLLYNSWGDLLEYPGKTFYTGRFEALTYFDSAKQDLFASGFGFKKILLVAVMTDCKKWRGAALISYDSTINEGNWME